MSKAFKITLDLVFMNDTDVEFVEGALTEFLTGWNKYLKREGIDNAAVWIEEIRPAKITAV